MSYLGENSEGAIDRLAAKLPYDAVARAAHQIMTLPLADRKLLVEELPSFLGQLPPGLRQQLLLLADRLSEQDLRAAPGIGNMGAGAVANAATTTASTMTTIANVATIVASVASVGLGVYGLIAGLKANREAKKKAAEQQDKAEAEARAAKAAALEEAQRQQQARDAALSQAEQEAAQADKKPGSALLVGGGLAAVAALMAAS